MKNCLLIFGFPLSDTDAHALALLGDTLSTSMGGGFAIHTVHASDRIELYIAAPEVEWEAFRNSDAGDRYARYVKTLGLLGLQVFDLVETIEPSGSFRSTNPTPKIT